MGTLVKFESLDIWQEARHLNKEVFLLFKSTTLGDDKNLRYQMDRSAASIMDNIAEGFEREGNRELIQYLSIAKASCSELRSQMYRAHDRNHIDEETLKIHEELSLQLIARIKSFMNYLRSSQIKGYKFKRGRKRGIPPIE